MKTVLACIGAVVVVMWLAGAVGLGDFRLTFRAGAKDPKMPDQIKRSRGSN